MAPQQELRDLERIFSGFPDKGNRGFYRELQPLVTKRAALKRVSQQPAVLIAHEGRAMLRKKGFINHGRGLRYDPEKWHAITIPSKRWKISFEQIEIRFRRQIPAIPTIMGAILHVFARTIGRQRRSCALALPLAGTLLLKEDNHRQTRGRRIYNWTDQAISQMAG